MTTETEMLAGVKTRSSLWLPWWVFPSVAVADWLAFTYDYVGMFVIAYLIATYVFREQLAGWLLLAMGMLFGYLIGVVIQDAAAVLPAWLMLTIMFVWGAMVSLLLFGLSINSKDWQLYLLSVERDNFVADLQQRNFKMAVMSLEHTVIFDPKWLVRCDLPVKAIRASRVSMRNFFLLARGLYETCPIDQRRGCDVHIMRILSEADAMVGVEFDAARYRAYLKTQEEETSNESQ